MKKKCLLLTAALSLVAGTGSAENMLRNPDFEHGLAGYMLGNGSRFEYREHRFVPTEHGNALEIVFRPSDNPWDYARRNDVGLFTPEIPIPPKTTYEFQFTVSSSERGQQIICGQYAYFQGDVSFTGKPQHYTLPGPPKTFSIRVKNDSEKVKWSGFNIFRRIDRSPVRKERETITISGLRFGPAGALETKTEPFTASLAVEGDPMVLNYHPGDKISFRITKLNRTKEIRKSKIVLLLKSRRNDRILERKEFAVELKPGRSEEVVTLTAPQHYGSARLEGMLDGIPFINAVKFTVSPTVRLKRGDLPLDLGTNSIMSLPEKKFHLQEQMNLLADGGFTCVRIWDMGNCFAWYKIEPEPGKFTWDRSDYFTETARKAGIDLLPVLGGMFTLDNSMLPFGRRAPLGAELPIWLYKRSKTLTSGTIPSATRKSVLPPMEDWERMVRETAKRYSKNIRMWEILNESEIYLDTKLYVPYLVSASRILKEIDPGCKVVGGGLTGDFGNDITSGLEEFLRLAGNHTDGLSFHPYGSMYEDAGRMPSDMLFARAAEALKKTGHEGLPLWNTEVYYLSPKSTGGGNHSVGPVFDPGCQVRRYLIDAANGVKLSTMLPGRYMLTNLINDNITGDYLGAFFANRILPGDKYVVSALFARNMKGFRFEKKLNLSGRMLAYLFRRGSECTAYVFALSVKENDTRRIHYPEAKNVLCRDLYEEPLLLKTEKPSPIPFRISGKAEDVERFLNGIRTEGDIPLIFHGMRMVRTPDRRMELYVDAEPCSSQTLEAESCAPVTLGTERCVTKLSLPQTTAARFNRMKTGTLKINGEERNGQISRCYALPVLERAPDFNPELTDKIWENAYSRNAGTGKIRLAVFNETLYFAASVKKKDLYRNPANPLIHLSDSVELFLDGKPFEDLEFARYAKTSKTARQLMFLPPYKDLPARVSGNEGEQWKELKYAFKVYPDHYNLLVSLPLSAIGSSGKEIFGFDCAINSWNGGKSWRKYTFSSNKEIFMNRMQFELMKPDLRK